MIHVLLPNDYQLWDIAGVDGLQVAKSLFGDEVGCIATFQSIETTLSGCPCSVVRLCEGNFRIAWQGNSTILEEAVQRVQGRRAWFKRFDWLGAIALSESVGLTHLPQIAVAKPPHRLKGMLLNCAAPARIEGAAILVWRHFVLGQSAFELHTAVKDLETVKVRLTSNR